MMRLFFTFGYELSQSSELLCAARWWKINAARFSQPEMARSGRDGKRTDVTRGH